MSHDSTKITQDIQRLSGFLAALLSVLRSSQTLPSKDFEGRINALLTQTDIDQESKRDALITFLRLSLGGSYKLSTERLSEIDDALTKSGSPTLTAMRKEIFGDSPPVFLQSLG